MIQILKCIQLESEFELLHLIHWSSLYPFIPLNLDSVFDVILGWSLALTTCSPKTEFNQLDLGSSSSNQIDLVKSEFNWYWFDFILFLPMIIFCKIDIKTRNLADLLHDKCGYVIKNNAINVCNYFSFWKTLLSRSISALTPSASWFATSNPWEVAWSWWSPFFNSELLFSSSSRAWDSSCRSTDFVAWNSFRSWSNSLSQLHWAISSRSKSPWSLASFSSACLFSVDKTSTLLNKSALVLSFSFRATFWLPRAW